MCCNNVAIIYICLFSQVMSTKQHKTNLKKSSLSIFFLLIYVGMFFGAPLLNHHHDHFQNSDNCTQEVYVSDCHNHQLISDIELNEECHHQSHFSEKTTNCELCDILLSTNPKILPKESQVVFSLIKAEISTRIILSQHKKQFSSKTSRAPPFRTT